MLKGYRYDVPLKVDFQVDRHDRRSAVLHTITPGPFGHDNMSDRAQELLWEYQPPAASRPIARCVRISSRGQLVSIGKVEEFCSLTEYVKGESYSHDVERIRDTGELTELDLARADALCDYLVEIHKVRGKGRACTSGAFVS